MKNSPPPVMWPHPDEMVSITQAAKLIQRNRSSLSRQIGKVRDGNAPQTRDPSIDIVARVFVEHAEGVNPSVKAALLIKALNIPSNQVLAPPPSLQQGGKKNVRQRISKKQLTRLRTQPAQKLITVFKDTARRVEDRNTINARRWLKEVIDVMAQRGIEFPRSQVDGVPPGRFIPFGSLSDWAANAGASDPYLFFYRHGSGRPLDYRLLTVEDDLESATFHFLTMDKWLSAMKHAMAQETSEMERRRIDVPPKKQSKRSTVDKSEFKKESI